MKPVLTAVIVSSLMIASCFAGSKLKKNHVTVLDVKTGHAVALEAPDNAQIYVAAPDGFEAGALAATSKDGKAILILPPSMMGGPSDDDKDQTPAPAPQPQNQMYQERLDHADLLRVSK